MFFDVLPIIKMVQNISLEHVINTVLLLIIATQYFSTKKGTSDGTENTNHMKNKAVYTANPSRVLLGRGSKK